VKARHPIRFGLGECPPNHATTELVGAVDEIDDFVPRDLLEEQARCRPVLPEGKSSVEKRTIPRAINGPQIEDVTVRLPALPDAQVANALCEATREVNNLKVVVLE
jgi:hypothetical protein